MAKYYHQTKPFIVPTTDGKLIEEHFGKASVNAGNYSIAHMIAPSGWKEPFQVPDFDEITFVFSGKKMVEINGEKIVLKANESIRISKGSRVRYSNPFDEQCEYVSFCIPAFSPDLVNRETQ